jgi:putative flippase GtrA
MALTPRAAWDWVRSPTGTKMVRYSLVSVVALAVSQVVLFLTFAVGHLWSAGVCNIVAAVAATPPSYYLNRRWAWGKTGRSHLMKEVVPFWVLAFLGLAFSTWAVDVAERYGREISSAHIGIIVNAASAAAYGVVWLVKFMIFNRLMFGVTQSPNQRLVASAVSPAGAEPTGAEPAVSEAGAAEASEPVPPLSYPAASEGELRAPPPLPNLSDPSTSTDGAVTAGDAIH